MSNPQAEKLELDNLGKLHQMKINTRLVALQTAQTLMGAPGYLPINGGPATNTTDAVTLLAIAGLVEEYVMGNLEAESIKAMETMKQRLDPSRPKIVRP